MPREGRTRSCTCLLCGPEGKLVSEHEWTEHRRQLQLEKRRLESLVFTATVHNQLGYSDNQNTSELALWRTSADRQPYAENGRLSALTDAHTVDLAIDADELISAFSNINLDETPTETRNIRAIFRERKNQIQRKLERSLNHISHRRNMKRLLHAQTSLKALQLRFDRDVKPESLVRGEVLEEMESSLSSIQLEVNSTAGKTTPVVELRAEIRAAANTLASKLKEWAEENCITYTPKMIIFDMGMSALFHGPESQRSNRYLEPYFSLPVNKFDPISQLTAFIGIYCFVIICSG